MARRRGAKDGAATDSSGDDADLLPDDGDDGPVAAATTDGGATRLTTRETMRFSATFCLVWFFVCHASSSYENTGRLMLDRQITSTPTA